MSFTSNELLAECLLIKGVYLNRETFLSEPLQSSEHRPVYPLVGALPIGFMNSPSWKVVDFRGYGYSTGHPSLGTMSSDGERVVEYLPTLFQRHALPWPWPGQVG